jgi:hypothetical protein
MSYLIASLTALLISIVINFAKGGKIRRLETRIKSYKRRIQRLDGALAGFGPAAWAYRLDGLSAQEEESLRA